MDVLHCTAESSHSGAHEPNTQELSLEGKPYLARPCSTWICSEAAATPARGQRGGRGGFPAPGRHPARPRFRPVRPAALSLRRHVRRGQRERPAAPGGAAQAGGRRGKNQGLAGSRGAPAVLHAECLQGCPAARRASREQSLPGAQVLCFTLKTGKEFWEAHGENDCPRRKKTVSTAKSHSLLPGPRAKLYRNPFL